MNMMKNEIGFILRQARLNHNYSQEGICQGICTPSYLCKIEQGQAKPSDEILQQLFHVLGIEYCFDESFIEETKHHLYQFFSCLEVDQDFPDCRKYFQDNHQKIQNSPLHLDYHLYLFYTYIKEKSHLMNKEKDYLSQFVSYMDLETKSKYYYFLALSIGNKQEAIEYMHEAIRLSSKSFYIYHLACIQFHIGQYEESMTYAKKAYQKASEDGNPYVLISASFLLGSCHCFYHNYQTAQMYFDRSIALCRGYSYSVEDYAYYNLGTSYMEKGYFEEALSCFEKIKSLDDEDIHPFLYHHKLAVLYLNNNMLDKTQIHIQQMKNTYQNLNQKNDIYLLMIENLEYMQDAHYLDNKKYEQTLKILYQNVEDIFGYGLKRFYATLLVELYKHQRRYKDALILTEKLKLS